MLCYMQLIICASTTREQILLFTYTNIGKKFALQPNEHFHMTFILMAMIISNLPMLVFAQILAIRILLQYKNTCSGNTHTHTLASYKCSMREYCPFFATIIHRIEREIMSNVKLYQEVKSTTCNKRLVLTATTTTTTISSTSASTTTKRIIKDEKKMEFIE